MREGGSLTAKGIGSVCVVSYERSLSKSDALRLLAAWTDTPPEADERYRAMFVQRTEEEQLIMGCAMWDKTHW